MVFVEVFNKPYARACERLGNDAPPECAPQSLLFAALMKGVIASGDHSYGEENYCAAGDKIAAMYGVPCLYKVENSGTADDIKAIMAIVV